ncbi:hypothetical protein Poli38472_001777 [Pythium oligandrum]|uniref:Uncharacterized protein n=1 Tax=Pythium oligandrum TaxID=41045 RepID=A0A8K1CTK4_PYTOL|nr:hypothetical protein Poli38472_001777 [Pythium oligandrum]|eukprot:TMW69621.1 hypothetical protein Poli38472_001777 [Pythium oligandrum]
MIFTKFAPLVLASALVVSAAVAEPAVQRTLRQAAADDQAPAAKVAATKACSELEWYECGLTPECGYYWLERKCLDTSKTPVPFIPCDGLPWFDCTMVGHCNYSWTVLKCLDAK